MFEKAKQLQWFEGFSVGNSRSSPISVSHLLFVDDTLIFCGAEKSQVLHLNITLMLFEAMSGLHINMLKSVIYPVNSVPNLLELADIMGCNTGSFPTTYLGLPLGTKYKSTEIWNAVVEKFEKKLATWQRQYISLGDKLTLINNVLDSIPTYFMALFPIPTKVQKQLDRIRRNFLWEGNNISHKIHLVKWTKVTLTKALGGLGVKDLALHNKSMLMKWHWRFNQDDAGLWKEVIIAKYGNTESLVSHNREGNTWNPILRRNLQDWEVEDYIDLLKLLENRTINTQLKDKLKWGNSKDGTYSVKARMHASPKTTSPESVSVNHLFLHCSVATDIWNMFLSIFGLHWTMPFNAREAYVSWSSREVDRTKVWNMLDIIFYVIFVHLNSHMSDLHLHVCFAGIPLYSVLYSVSFGQSSLFQ
ncbi:uncharacterized protein [Nicotiana sylvestris]|uniref:uncharacterized protein n=1 Tax=Nicotiana sylvestris TaxID=4096 RepID=UPI00388C5380